MKTLIMRKEIQGEEGIQGKIYGNPKLRLWFFCGNLNSENYLNWVQAYERIIELKDYNDEITV